MVKSIASKLVAVSASAVIASVIIPSSASALTVPQQPAHLPCVPHLALTSDGELHGTCFGPAGPAWLGYWDQVPYSDGAQQVLVAADGSFTLPLANTNLEELRYAENTLFLVGEQSPGGAFDSNVLEVQYSGPLDLNLRAPAL